MISRKRCLSMLSGAIFKGQIILFILFTLNFNSHAANWQRLSIAGSTASTVNIFNDNSCVALYKMENNANDSSANGYNLNPINISYLTAAPTPKIGSYSASFTSNSALTIGYTSPLGNILDSTNKTISIFVNFSNGASGGRYLANSAWGGPSFTTRAEAYPTSWTVSTGCFPSYYNYTCTQNMNDGKWHSLIYTRANNVHNMYIDGVLCKSFTDSAAINCGGSDTWSIGGAHYAAGWMSHFLGQMDQIRIFNRALTATEVQQVSSEY